MSIFDPVFLAGWSSTGEMLRILYNSPGIVLSSQHKVTCFWDISATSGSLRQICRAIRGGSTMPPTSHCLPAACAETFHINQHAP